MLTMSYIFEFGDELSPDAQIDHSALNAQRSMLSPNDWANQHHSISPDAQIENNALTNMIRNLGDTHDYIGRMDPDKLVLGDRARNFAASQQVEEPTMAGGYKVPDPIIDPYSNIPYSQR